MEQPHCWLVAGLCGDRLCGVLSPTAAHAACAAAHWQSSQTSLAAPARSRDTVRMPSDCALGTGYAVACHRDSYATYAVKTPAVALRQLACCKTLANQASSRKLALSGATGALEAILVLQESYKDSVSGSSTRLRREQPCQTQTWRKAKTACVIATPRRRPGIPSSTSSKNSICRRVG